MNKEKGWRDKKRLTIAVAMERLMDEIVGYTQAGHNWRIDPEEIIISANLKFRQDGQPYSNQKEPEDPGVAVYFVLDGKQYCLPCDKWTRPADNIAAIAAHIAANRGIERWGVGQSSDVYAGYAALPAAGETTAFDYWGVLGIEPTSNREAIHKAWLRQSKLCHPDQLGGSEARWHELHAAKQHALQEAPTISKS